MSGFAKKLLDFVLSLLTLLQCSILISADKSQAVDENSELLESTDVSAYLNYFNHNIEASEIYGYLDLHNISQINTEKNTGSTDISGKTAYVLNEKNNYIQYTFEVQEDGLYALTPFYYQLHSSGKDITVRVELDGEIPFTEAANFSLPRIYVDKKNDNNEFEKDIKGNDLRPQQVENPMWTTYSFKDSYGLFSEPYLFYLTKGIHNLKLSYIDEEFAIAALYIGVEEEAEPYSQYIKEYSDKKTKNEIVYQQAENTAYKNNSLLYPTYDRGSAATVPNDPIHIKLNTIGQTNWQNNGETIYYKPQIKSAGLYRITFKARQSYNYGMASYRTLRINGEIPFKEAENIEFFYSLNWENTTLGNNSTDMLVYLEPGDTVSLECVAGKAAEFTRRLQENVNYLSDVYREILIITGSSPDPNRDYNLSEQIPELEEKLIQIHKNLIYISRGLEKIFKSTDSQISSVLEAADLLYNLANRTDTIPSSLDSIQSNIEALGNLIMGLQQQPLELDYIVFTSENVEVPKAESGFLEQLAFGFKKLLNSYISKYDGIDKKSNKLNLWVSTGRDQAQILERMLNDDFSVKYNADVELSIVDTGSTLIKATLAGKGPDVAFMISQDLVVNLAMRDALVNIKNYDFSDLKSETTESAWIPFFYNDGLYALPENETFDVLFYRTDIFNKLGLQVPETWDDFYNVIKVLQTNSLEIGLQEINSLNAGVSAGIGIFNKLLFQNGGTYYSEDLSKALFNTVTAYEAFTKWTEFYTIYGLERDFNFFNRFRSGVMPIGITSYSQYNQLMGAAPEIRGLWKIALAPGTRKSDGTIDRTQSSSVTGCMVLSQAEKNNKLNSAIELIKWWTSADTQTRYSEELEATMGVTARYTPANIKTLESIKWTKDELDVLKAAREELLGVPEIPGNYLIARSLTSAFRETIAGVNEPWRSLMLYNKVINNEITRKREEFGLGDK